MTQNTISQPDPTGPVSEGVTQADRDLFKQLFAVTRFQANEIDAGMCDSNPDMLKLARHRLASPIGPFAHPDLEGHLADAVRDSLRYAGVGIVNFGDCVVYKPASVTQESQAKSREPTGFLAAIHDKAR